MKSRNLSYIWNEEFCTQEYLHLKSFGFKLWVKSIPKESHLKQTQQKTLPISNTHPRSFFTPHNFRQKQNISVTRCFAWHLLCCHTDRNFTGDGQSKTCSSPSCVGCSFQLWTIVAMTMMMMMMLGYAILWLLNNHLRLFHRIPAFPVANYLTTTAPVKGNWFMLPDYSHISISGNKFDENILSINLHSHKFRCPHG